MYADRDCNSILLVVYEGIKLYVCFILPHPATFVPLANRPHGLKAEAIAVEKWGIATDRLFFIKKIRLLAPAHWAFGSCVMGYLGVPSFIRESSLTSKSLTMAHLYFYCQEIF